MCIGCGKRKGFNSLVADRAGDTPRGRGPKGEVKQRAQYPNHVWSYDFVEDRTTRGSQLRVLCVLDEYTRECLSLLPDRSISSRNVLQVLDWLCLLRGVPEHIRSDNGPEFIAKRVRQWLAERECDTIFITPGSPWENPYIESFIGTLSRECLDRYLFDTVRDAQQLLETWRHAEGDTIATGHTARLTT